MKRFIIIALSFCLFSSVAEAKRVKQFIHFMPSGSYHFIDNQRFIKHTHKTKIYKYKYTKRKLYKKQYHKHRSNISSKKHMFNKPANMVPIKASNGITTYVAPKAQAVFQALIDKLEAAGTVIKSLGGYAFRFIDPRYTHRRRILSEHAKGLALDINQRDRNVVDPPLKGNIGIISAELGLKSGADWRSPDKGHFQLRDGTPSKWPRVLIAKKLELNSLSIGRSGS